MKRWNFASVLLFITAVALLLVPVSVDAAKAKRTTTKKTTTPQISDQQRLSNLKTTGSAEITRRLSTLANLNQVIDLAVKMSAIDKTNLKNQVNQEISGLSTLKTKLAADTTLTAARTDAKIIVSDYRVYALIVPKVRLLKTSDTISVNTDKLGAFAAKLQTRISQISGPSAQKLQAQLNDVNNQLKTAGAIVANVNMKVSALQPTDYNANHAVLIGQYDQLQSAHKASVAALNEAKAIVKALTSPTSSPKSSAPAH